MKIPYSDATAGMSSSIIEGMANQKRRQTNPAIDIAEDVLAALKAFQDTLRPSEDISVSIPNLPPGARVDQIKRLGSHLLIFEGTADGGARYTAIQHCNQVSVLMMAAPAQDQTPRRIGFMANPTA
jgi:hypothetical protein